MNSQEYNALGDRLKAFESIETDRKLMPYVTTYARIDGRSFHKFTKQLDKPFDENLRNVMVETATALIRDTNADLVYTQSDEINIFWFNGINLFGNRTSKINSVLAGLASSAFTVACRNSKGYYTHNDKTFTLDTLALEQLPHFDCRVMALPSKEEAANMLMWRQSDAAKNAMSMAASKYYSSKQLHKKKFAEMKDMLAEKGVDFYKYPDWARKGTLLKMREISKVLTPTEVEEKVRANPKFYLKDNTYTRKVLSELPVSEASMTSQATLDYLFNQ